ncbi:MAG TPA: NADPH-dependent FMN reductase [Longimicrobiales bacterium]|nr:NADPH-dependent FMN reductase [Longimicrobiales bacterium]
MPTILCISGTSRPDNYTARALGVVTDELTRRGHPPVVLDAREMELAFPGRPATDDSRRLQEAVREADAVVLATPEYHGGFSAMTKLIIESLGFPSLLADKPVALLGVASGRIGAIKSLEQLRGVCSHAGGIVLPRSVSVAGVRGAFDDAGNCTDPDVEKALRGLADSVLSFMQAYVCPRFTLEAIVREDGRPWPSSI